MNDELNSLTRWLYAQGYTRDHHPDTVCWSDWKNFGYKWETMLGFTWETPCGLLIQGESEVGRSLAISECSYQRVWYCPENDNPLLRCPYQQKGCAHVPQGFPLIMCPCHRTDRTYDHENSVEKIETANHREAHKQYMELTGGSYCACVVGSNGYLAPLGMTDYDLTDRCGFGPAAQKLYGGKEKRGTWIDALRESGSSDAVTAAVAEERKEIELFWCDPARQTQYIQTLLNDHVNTYLKSKENGGQTFPDFMGSLVLNELPRCEELSAVYKAKCQTERDARTARVEAEEKAYCEEQNRAAEKAVSKAIQIIQGGGVLKNDTIKFYRSRYDARSYSIVNYLMRRYHVEVPLRTQGWIKERLVNATIENGKCERLQYYRRAKTGRGSQKFFQCMNELIRAVTAQPTEEQEAEAA